MLQQTRVATVIPYFERWVDRFEDFEVLAEAEETEVLSYWQGLGYYSRARNLHKLSQIIRDQGIPGELQEWLKLPGIGPYTAAAIASISQNVPASVVDGNVVRVLSRLSADERCWKSSGEAVKGFAGLAEEFLDRENPGRHNEAVMEMGATICTPKSPMCTICPLLNVCHAARKGLAAELPRIRKSKKVERTVDRIWVRRENQVLLKEISKSAKRLAGMVELPSTEDFEVNLSTSGHLIAKKKRGIGNEVITERIHSAEAALLDKIPKGLVWANLDSLQSLPISGPHRRWIEELLADQ